ncbi:hypothetical protein [Sphaerochaeta pleomorpha]|nr:hypothetical protein [Sphaerochaeta pleomorpha]
MAKLHNDVYDLSSYLYVLPATDYSILVPRAKMQVIRNGKYL